MMRQLALELAPPAAPAFDNFVPGRNLEAKRQLEQLAARGAGERFVYLWGEPGSGRTHLLRATCAALLAQGRGCAYLGCDGVTVSMALPRTVECLAVDDVERLPEAGQIALFNAYNELRERGGALVAAGDAPPVQLPLRADLVTRLGWGLVYHLHTLTDEEKAQALTDEAAHRGFDLTGDVTDYLLRHVRRDMASLVAMLDALDRYSLAAKRPVTLSLVRELVREQSTENESNNASGTL